MSGNATEQMTDLLIVSLSLGAVHFRRSEMLIALEPDLRIVTMAPLSRRALRVRPLASRSPLLGPIPPVGFTVQTHVSRLSIDRASVSLSMHTHGANFQTLSESRTCASTRCPRCGGFAKACFRFRRIHTFQEHIPRFLKQNAHQLLAHKTEPRTVGRP